MGLVGRKRKTQREGRRVDREGRNEKLLKGRGTEARAPDDQGTQDKPLRVLLIRVGGLRLEVGGNSFPQTSRLKPLAYSIGGYYGKVRYWSTEFSGDAP